MAGLDADEGLKAEELVGLLDKALKENADLNNDLALATMKVDELLEKLARLQERYDFLILNMRREK